MKIAKLLLGLFALLIFAGCQQMDPTEYGVKFRKLPPFLGGGVAEGIIRPGEVVVLMPWESIYGFDTKPKDVSWGSSPGGSSGDPLSDYVYTRASDGNEVALAFTVRYRISPEPEKLVKLVQTTATSDEEVRNIVIAVGRSDIRRYMNELQTSEFLNTTTRYKAVDRVKEAMAEVLEPLGIDVVQVNLDDYRFERKLKDGSTDASYQARLTEIQQLTEDTERERSRTETVKAQKEREKRSVEALKGQMEAEAIGFRNQAKLRADAYFDAKSNEAKGILAKGKSEVQGMIEQIQALAGPGGEALFQLELVRQLRQSNAKFIVLGSAKNGSGVDVNRIDTNQLMQQLGIIEGVKDSPPIDETRAQMRKQNEQPK